MVGCGVLVADLSIPAVGGYVRRRSVHCLICLGSETDRADSR